MDSLGRMAAGVAHDFNNLLLGVSLAIGVLEDAIPKGATEREAAADARALIDQGARLVKSLLTFARQGAYGGQPVEVHAHVNQMLPSLRRLLGPDVELSAQLDSRPARVRMDPAVLEQVVLNLVLNARDAMPGGGSITLRSEIQEGRLLLSVRDTGLGMSAAIRQRIFEPFFTTRGGAGNGLGLAIVFGSVRAADGTIDVESEPGRGSTFLLRLPLEGSRSLRPEA
jgi:two-component system, cell cycle sensor histidine kinase and response regulator CckA